MAVEISASNTDTQLLERSSMAKAAEDKAVEIEPGTGDTEDTERATNETKPKTDFNYDKLDWAAYVRYRPQYRPELYKMVYDHHAAHSTTWARAYDVGAGAGIAAAELLNRFNHVTVSDPIIKYVEAAEENFKNIPSDRVAFVQHRGEDPLDAPPDSLDLVTMAECIPLMDQATALRNAHKYLRRDGTIAVWMYGPQFHFDERAPPGVEGAWDEAFSDWEREVSKFFNTPKRVEVFASHFDSIHFDPKLWRDVRRSHWLPGQEMLGAASAAGRSVAVSRVEAGESVENMEFHDMFAVDDVDAEWINGYVKSMVPQSVEKTSFLDQYPILKEVLGDQKFHILYPSVLITATKC